MWSVGCILGEMINGKAIERFFSMANDQGMTNRSFYSKVFGEDFVNNMTDIGSILKLLQSGGDEEFIKVMSKDSNIWRGTRNLLLGQLDRKRTFIRGLKQLAKEINNRDMFKGWTFRASIITIFNMLSCVMHGLTKIGPIKTQ